METHILTGSLLPDILLLEEVCFFMAEVLGVIGVGVMAYGAFKGVYRFLEGSLHFRKQDLPRIRIELGKHLALGLEFLVGKDIIESIVSPTWDDLGKLAAIIALRTAVTFMLSWELKEIKEELDEEEQRSAVGSHC